MSTPDVAENTTEQPKKITFRFCRECSNMLYPREDKANNELIFSCRTCNFAEPATSSCVFRNELSNTVGETAGITQDVGSDPTVGDLNVDPFPLCTMCGQELVCEDCGEPIPDGGFCLEVLDHGHYNTHVDDEDPMSDDEDVDMQMTSHNAECWTGNPTDHATNRSSVGRRNDSQRS